MKHIVKVFEIGLKQICKDGIFLVMLLAPFFIGIFFKLVIPMMNSIFITEFSFSIAPWYALIDGMLICLTPMFVAMISAFLLLEERDEGLNAFYQITPAEGYSYIYARVGIPMIWAFFITILVTILFHLSSLSLGVILTSALISNLTGICLAMMVVSFAGNRVEGLAISKLMGISFIGLILIWFIPAPYYYFMAFLPSFWIGLLLMDGLHIITFTLGIIFCLLWTAFFTRKFLKRI